MRRGYYWCRCFKDFILSEVCLQHCLNWSLLIRKPYPSRRHIYMKMVRKEKWSHASSIFGSCVNTVSRLLSFKGQIKPFSNSFLPFRHHCCNVCLIWSYLFKEIWVDSSKCKQWWAVCWGLNCGPRGKICWVLTPSTFECEIIWKEKCYARNQSKIGSLGWTLVQRDWYLYKREKLEVRDMHAGRTPKEDGGKQQGVFLPAARTRTQGRELKSFSHSLQEEPTLPPSSASRTSSIQNGQLCITLSLLPCFVVLCEAVPVS